MPPGFLNVCSLGLPELFVYPVARGPVLREPFRQHQQGEGQALALLKMFETGRSLLQSNTTNLFCSLRLPNLKASLFCSLRLPNLKASLFCSLRSPELKQRALLQSNTARDRPAPYGAKLSNGGKISKGEKCKLTFISPLLEKIELPFTR